MPPHAPRSTNCKKLDRFLSTASASGLLAFRAKALRGNCRGNLAGRKITQIESGRGKCTTVQETQARDRARRHAVLLRANCASFPEARICGVLFGHIRLKEARKKVGAAPMRILLVEDHAALANQVVSRIERAGYDVDRVDTIERAVLAVDSSAYSLALLDRRLPDGDGISLIPRLRKKQPAIRILMLTALDAIDDKINGLEAGADDYLTKPFNLDEMIARIRAQLRNRGCDPTPPVEIGALSFDLDQRSVSILGQPTVFSRGELILLETLIRRANCVVSREALNAQLYGHGLETQDHALTSLVSRLRIRLTQLRAGVEIHSARALGYILREIKSEEYGA